MNVVPSIRNPFRIALLAVMVVVNLGGGGQGALGQAPANAPANQQYDWQEGPSTAKLGTVAEIAVPRGYLFTGAEGTKRLMEEMQNPISGSELGFMAPEDDSWFIVFEYDEVGHVKDDDRDNLDADALLESIREGNEEANRERERRGWPPLKVLGWEQPPHYDPATNNLVWATRAESEGELSVNYNTRRLGRIGVMRVTLVGDPSQLKGAIPKFNEVMKGFSFTAGNRYAEFRAGDKLAQYGLTGLIAGGAAVAASKAGLFKGLWKILAVAGVGIAAFVRRLFGRKETA